MCTLPCPIILSAKEIVPFLLVIKEVVDYSSVNDLRILAIGVELDVICKGFDVGIIAADNDSRMVVILIDLHKLLNLCRSISSYNIRLVDDP